ncbi:hypothetical protein PAERUG_E16_London_17_VIM_2_04_14_03909 [Pseudomonas aeruginosa]|nr:hypothetical protein PAERUG_E16_London_17_VIM_2_04_14_03909 [Pseudomonas aeruginosa]
MLVEGEGVLHGFVEQQVGLGLFAEVFAEAQAQLQLQGDAAVGDLDLQGMAERTHQFTAAERVGQVVGAVVAAVEENQAAAVAERVQAALVLAGGLFQAVAIALQEIHQAAARQPAQLFLSAELDRQHRTVLRFARSGGRCGLFPGFGSVLVEGVLVQRVFVDGGEFHRLGLVQQGVAQRNVVFLEGRGLDLAAAQVGFVVFQQDVVEVLRQRCFFRLRRRRLLRHQALFQVARQVAQLVLQFGAGGRIVRIAQPDTQLQQGCGNLPPQAQAEIQGEDQQDQADQAHALQADHHRLLELLHVQADAQVPGDHFLEGDRRRVQAFGGAEQALLRTAAGLGEDALVDAVDRRMGHQRVLHQVVEQHVEAEDVVGHQQLGGGRGGLGDQALAQGIGLLLHGLAKLHAHDPGVDQQGQGHQDQAMAGEPQGDRDAALAQGTKQQEEEIVGLDGRGPGHRGLGLLK